MNATISGLQQDTRYYYRLVATSSRGTSAGEEGAFSTAGPPEAATLPATFVGYAEAQLNASLKAKNSPTHYYFEYGTSEAYDQKTAEQYYGEGDETLEEGERVGNLNAHTNYHYRVVTINEYGTTYGADQTFATAEEPFVQTGAAEAVDYRSATLVGSVDPGGTSTEYLFEYGKSETYGRRTSPIDAGAGTGAVTATQKVSGLAEASTYHFRLVALTAYGTAYGADRTFSTGSQPSVETTGGGKGGGTTETPNTLVKQPDPLLPPPSPPPAPTAHPTGAAGRAARLLSITRRGDLLSLALSLSAPLERVEASATVPAVQLGAGGRGRTRALRVARLVRAKPATGRSRLLLVLDARVRQALRRGRRLTVTIAIATVTAGGLRHTITRTFVLSGK
ncbi:MAG TPA: hypothetical protein VHU13_04590 [Solirubrobacteraceae bacterium]|nr:hypothetical protein [Solirubrobacteraceae bacterium]